MIKMYFTLISPNTHNSSEISRKKHQTKKSQLGTFYKTPFKIRQGHQNQGKVEETVAVV